MMTPTYLVTEEQHFEVHATYRGCPYHFVFWGSPKLHVAILSPIRLAFALPAGTAITAALIYRAVPQDCGQINQPLVLAQVLNFIERHRRGEPLEDAFTHGGDIL